MSQPATAYEVVIGLEVHAQVATASKMFCPCPATYAGAAPNTHVCPICLGMPGVLPVMNRDAVEKTLLFALALGCTIPHDSKFDRKNYPYPDLMKGYQISQYDMPFSVNGHLDVDLPDGTVKRVGVTRVHLEEDTAMLRHESGAGGERYSVVDVNRAGSPLMEIVSEPDMRSPEEARRYLEMLREILRYTGVSRANMEEGNFRCDANISLRRFGAPQYGTKVEIKNMNSFRSVQMALEYEVRRQSEMLDRGEQITQETRGWLEAERRTVSQRSKEQAHDYRYFPEPDLPPVRPAAAWIEQLRVTVPELPQTKRHRFVEQYGLSAYDANLLSTPRARAEFFEQTIAIAGAARAKQVSNWLLGDIARLQNAHGQEFEHITIAPAQVAELIDLVERRVLNSTTAKAVLERIYTSGGSPTAAASDLGLVSAPAAGLDALLATVIAANPRAVTDFRGGKANAVQALVGAVMRETRGTADAAQVRELLLEKLARD